MLLATRCFFLLSVLSVLLAPLSAAQERALPPNVRVRLFAANAPSEVTFEANGPVQFYAGRYRQQPILQLQRGEEVAVSVRGEELRLRTESGTLFARSLLAAPEGTATWSVGVTSGARPAAARRYAGALTLSVAGGATLQLVNRVDLDTYVAGVVASEYGFDDLEGSKAMAVAARTYALQQSTAAHGDYDQDDHVGSQVYRGLDKMTPVAREAASATRGEVLTHDGALIEAFYFASSGGRTASNEDVWDGPPRPYLRGKADPYDDASPHASWRATLDRRTLLKRLSKAYGFDVRGFTVEEKSADGRVHTVELLGPGTRSASMSGNDFRLFANEQTDGLGIRSTLFDAERSGGRYVFEGRGWGHGVGLSQYGARQMAQRGADYKEILSFYYTDVHLAHLGAPAESTPLDDAPPVTVAQNGRSAPEASAPNGATPGRAVPEAADEETDAQEEKGDFEVVPEVAAVAEAARKTRAAAQAENAPPEAPPVATTGWGTAPKPETSEDQGSRRPGW